MTKQQALDWFEWNHRERLESFTVPDKKTMAYGMAVSCIRESIAREPRLLTLNEVADIGRQERDRMSGEDVNPVWLEETTTWHDEPTTTLYMVLISKTFDFQDAGEETFYARYFGTDHDESLRPERYGKLWRCWSAKPSKELMEVTPWHD